MAHTGNLQLIIGDKNLSSWSLRPWLVLKASGLPFKETLIWLDRKDSKRNLQRFSPTGKVPLLIHGQARIWDSLAISEYIAEQAPLIDLWPSDSFSRARARSIVAEIHSSFHGLRTQLSMDIRLRLKLLHLTAETINDIRRVLEIWDFELKKSKGPFLFGDFGIADAFSAPVVFRFQSYGIQILSARIQRYMQSMLTYPAMREWERAARREKVLQHKFSI